MHGRLQPTPVCKVASVDQVNKGLMSVEKINPLCRRERRAKFGRRCRLTPMVH